MTELTIYKKSNIEELKTLIQETKSLIEKSYFNFMKLQTIFNSNGEEIRLIDLQSNPPESFYS